MSRIINMKCPKCGGMYMKEGRCETCGFIIDEALANRSEPKQDPIVMNKNLMPCPDCGRMISKDAISCPQCGCPFPANNQHFGPQQKVVVQKNSGAGVLGTIVAIVIAGLALWYIAAPYTTPVWLQKIGGTIRCFFTGETSYKIFNPSKIP